MMRPVTRKGALLLVGFVLVPLCTRVEARAQEEVTVIDAGGVGSDLVVPTRPNLFQLRAFGDEGAAGVRSNGSNIWCMQNIVGFANRNQFGCGTGWFVRQANGFYTSAIFDMGMKWAAPASDLPDVIDPATSGLSGGGYTVNMTTLIIGGAVNGGGDKLWASDRSPIDLLNLAAKTTEDATCLNHSAARDGNMNTGFQLTPTSDCEATHPAAGWKGSHPIPAESYLSLQASAPEFSAMYDGMAPHSYDPFAFWRVPEEMQATDKFLGDWQTYGELTDHYRNALERYGSVIPGGAGSPSYAGWPLGLTQFYDIFYFGLPTVANVMYFQSIIVNESEKVYGVGMTYDSVYIGMNVDPLLQGQGDAHYYDPVRSAMLWKETGSRCADAIDPPGSGCQRDGIDDWANGAAGAGIVFLKTPIGDARYKLFSDPSSDFYNPSHPRAGDTIMFQHQRQCGFGGCIPRTWSRSQRAHFGHFTSIGEYTLDGETPGDLDERTYHRTFRPEAWPERTGVYNKYVPGEGEVGAPMWDWNHDGQPDTIYADACGSRGCVALWADTLPSGYTNSYGNISDLAVGPVHMAPGDTVPFVVALVGAADSASMEGALDNAIGFYQQMFLGPETAPPPAISAVDVVAGQAATTGDVEGNRISLFFDDTSEEWEDVYLTNLDVTSDVPLNYWLADSIQARATNNVAAIHIFKSCDGGSTFTQDGDCDGDPIFDETSKWSNFGWQPYVTFEAEDDGTIPNVFTDFALVPGVTYTYSIITETRGAKFNVIRGTNADSLIAEEVEFAPELLSPVSASGTNPNVAVVYAPLNLAAGASRAELTEVSRSGTSSVPVDFNVIGTAPVSGQYQVVFGDKLVVSQVDNLDDTGSPTSTQTTVAVQQVRTVTGVEGEPEEVVIGSVDFNRSGTVTRSGLEEQPPDSAMQGSMQRTTVFEGGFGMLVAAGSTPLLASSTLTDGEATPGAFYSRDDFPFFVVNVDASLGGSFWQQYFTTSVGDTIPARVAPAVSWLTGPSGYVGGGEYGEYAIVWDGDSWGSGAPFQVSDAAIESTVAGSLSGRPSASTSRMDESVLEAVMAFDPDIAELESYALPFSVRNNSYGRDVDVVVVEHQESVLVGQGVDSVRVEVPAGLWVPGDRLLFVETVTLEMTDESGNTVMEGGQPATEEATVVTFDVTLGCLAPRPSCDPTTGGDVNSGYIPITEQTTLAVEWLVPLRAGDQIVVDVQKAITAAEARAAGPVSLENVHVVPNPYLYGSTFERSSEERVLKFTNLPQEGTIRIFDVAGRFIQELTFGPEDLEGISSFCGAGDCGGDLNWDMNTRERTNLGAGLYIFVLESGGDKKMGKFVIIR